jgi:NAD(P)H-flavin reductase
MSLGECRFGELLRNTAGGGELFRLDFAWAGPVPRAGQFFLIRPKRSGVFLGRPISAARWEPPDGPRRNGRVNTVQFLIAKRGRGTEELAAMRAGEEAELTGPLGNGWKDFLPGNTNSPIALIGGGIGLAPLAAFASELPEVPFHFYAGFRTLGAAEDDLLGPFLYSRETVIATEDGSRGRKGRIPGFLDPAKYSAVYACGPEPMLRTVAASCEKAGTPCFVSLERRMACGVGACLGCTVKTTGGNRRCCADGPIFPAAEVFRPSAGNAGEAPFNG